MSQSGPLFGFSLRDTVTRLIPGLVFLAPITVGIRITNPTLLPNSTQSYILVALVAYLIGEFVDQIRLGLFRVPLSFRYFVYKETDQLEKMPSWYVRIYEFQERLPDAINFYEEIEGDQRLVNNLELNFRNSIETELGINFVENRPREIYDLLLIYMSGDLTPRLRRMQSVSIFSTNLRIATAMGTIFYTLYLVFNLRNPVAQAVWVTSLVFLLLVTAFWTFLTVAQYHYDELLLKEYYIKQTQSRSADSG